MGCTCPERAGDGSLHLLAVGPKPDRRRKLQMVVARPAAEPARPYPGSSRIPAGFSQPMRQEERTDLGIIGGRPVRFDRKINLPLHELSRCQRRSVWGVTMNDDQRSLGTTLATRSQQGSVHRPKSRVADLRRRAVFDPPPGGPVRAPDGLRSRDLRLDRAVRTARLLYGRVMMRGTCPQRDSNPCRRLERAKS